MSLQKQIKTEIIVPLFYNNGTEIEQEKFKLVLEELINKFGGCSIDNNTINGYWLSSDKKQYNDTNKVYWIIADNTEDNKRFFSELQKRLKELFKQESILIYITEILNLMEVKN